MLFIIMQQVQPLVIICIMQSQQLWIIFSMLASPLVHIMQQPMSIISMVHLPIIPMFMQQTHMPFIIMQHEHMPPAIIIMRFFIISADVLSSQLHVIFMPPGHFSMVIVQRGIIMPPGIMLIMSPIMGIIEFMPIIMGFIIGIIPIFAAGLMGAPIVIPRPVVVMFMAISFYAASDWPIPLGIEVHPTRVSL